MISYFRWNVEKTAAPKEEKFCSGLAERYEAPGWRFRYGVKDKEEVDITYGCCTVSRTWQRKMTLHGRAGGKKKQDFIFICGKKQNKRC